MCFNKVSPDEIKLQNYRVIYEFKYHQITKLTLECGELLDEVMENTTHFNEGSYKMFMENLMEGRNRFPSKFIEGDLPPTLRKKCFIHSGNRREGMVMMTWTSLDCAITALEGNARHLSTLLL